MELKQLKVTVEGPDIVIDALEQALAESEVVLLKPETIFPGYDVDVVHSPDD